MEFQEATKALTGLDLPGGAADPVGCCREAPVGCVRPE